MEFEGITFEELDRKVPEDVPLKAAVTNGPSFANVTVQLDGTTGVVGDYGSMLWINSAGGDSLTISTWCHAGGCCAGYWRQCASEARCFNLYAGTGEVSFGFDLPGDIIPLQCKPNAGWIITRGGFVCGTPNLCVSGQWKGCQACCCSGEGGFLTHVTIPTEEPNLFFAGGFGHIDRQTVGEGQTLMVNTGLFFGAQDNISIDVGTPGDCTSFCCSGEGFVMKFSGPVSVYTQNRDPDKFMALLNPRAAGGGGGGEDGGGGGE